MCGKREILKDITKQLSIDKIIVFMVTAHTIITGTKINRKFKS